MSDLSELFEQLADRPVLLATDSVSADAELYNGASRYVWMPRVQWRRDSYRRRREVHREVEAAAAIYRLQGDARKLGQRGC